VIADNDVYDGSKQTGATVVAVAGEGAGANLAINVSTRARDEKIQAPIYQLLVYPVAGNNVETDSYKENAQAKPLNKPMIPWFLKNYLNTPEESKDTRIKVLAANLKGLPPTTLITAQIDPLRSE
jgi:acetyl esterase